VGSEMCIRDRPWVQIPPLPPPICHVFTRWGVTETYRDFAFANGNAERFTPTIARAVPAKSDLAPGQLLGYEPLATKESSPTSNRTPKRLARLVALSRSTQGRGFASLFHLSTPGSLSVNGCDCPGYVPKPMATCPELVNHSGAQWYGMELGEITDLRLAHNFLVGLVRPRSQFSKVLLLTPSRRAQVLWVRASLVR